MARDNELEQRIQFYKLIDTTFGVLDQLMRVENELLRSRYAQVRMRTRGVWQRGIAALAITTAAIAALYSLVPEGSRKWWIGVFVLLVAIYVIMLAFQYFYERDAESELQKLLPKNAFTALEFQALYLATQISAAGTRIDFANSVLDLKPSAGAKRRFEKLREYWRARLDELESDATDARTKGIISAEEHADIKEWLRAARRVDRDANGEEKTSNEEKGKA